MSALPRRENVNRTLGMGVLPVQLEDYFDCLSPDDIRVRGHRIGIESILYEYIHRSKTPEEIAERFRTLSLEEIYATILYYLRNREAVSAYMARWLEHGEQARQAQENDPSFQQLRERLRQVRAERLERETPVGPVGTG